MSTISRGETSIYILCGGKGKRLKDLSSQIPKALVPINGKPILSYALEHLAVQGFKKFIFGTGYLSNMIESFVKNFKPTLECIISNTGIDTSMLARIEGAQNLFSEYNIVCYGDTFIDLNYPTLLEEHINSGKLMTMVTGQIQNPFGVLSINSQDEVTSFVEKPVYDHYIGCFVFSKNLLEQITSSMTSLPDGQGLVKLFEKLIEKRQIRAYQHKGLKITFNTETELHDAQKTLQDYFTVAENE